MKRSPLLPAAVLAVLLAGTGCAGGPGSPGGPGDGAAAAEPDPAEAMADTAVRIEADSLRVVVPERLAGDLVRPPGGGPPWEFRVRSLVLVAREIPPEILVTGEDFSVEAEGIVTLRRISSEAGREEGPYRTFLLRNGRMLRR